MEQKRLKLLNMAVNLYHDLLYKNKQDYLSQWEFLAKWKIEQLDIRKFKIGYCSPNSPFVKYYAESLEKYPIFKKECLSLGLLSESQEGIKDALIDTFLFPVLMNKAIYSILLSMNLKRVGIYFSLKNR
ncbi:hypothetical protein BLFGPEAP_01503 [Candidatus Methanoperedenaceae archaeon GB50]|nr:hypothetical protein BLFGPEAP_01503 [Candidatus Methanoperedenaceae archaeon GB50]